MLECQAHIKSTHNMHVSNTVLLRTLYTIRNLLTNIASVLLGKTYDSFFLYLKIVVKILTMKVCVNCLKFTQTVLYSLCRLIRLFIRTLVIAYISLQ